MVSWLERWSFALDAPLLVTAVRAANENIGPTTDMNALAAHGTLLRGEMVVPIFTECFQATTSSCGAIFCKRAMPNACVHAGKLLCAQLSCLQHVYLSASIFTRLLSGAELSCIIVLCTNMHALAYELSPM